MKPRQSSPSLPENPALPVSPENPILVTKVTRIGKRWHCRLYYNHGNGFKVFEEQACTNSLLIGNCCRDMLRWYDKCGGMSKQASASRHRLGIKNRSGHKVSGTITVIHPPYSLDTIFSHIE